MEKLFDICVEIMKYLSLETGFTYKEINIIIFVIIHPLITLYYYVLSFIYKLKTEKRWD